MAGKERNRRSVNGYPRASHWRSVIADWSRSGLSQRAYCDRKHLAVGTFAWWKHHLRSATPTCSRPTVPDRPEFVRVRVRGGEPAVGPPADSWRVSKQPSAAPPPASLEIVMSGDLTVRIYPECDVAMLIRVLDVLRGGLC